MGIHERMPMMRFVPTLFAVLIMLLPGLPTQAASDTSWTPSLDLRVRQEVFDGVLHFAPDPDRNQIRFRTRAGLTYARHAHQLKVQLANEHRRYLHPDGIDFDWDELIVDQLFWHWKGETAEVTVGRQNIIWDDGFLMLEAKPYDGSRSIFHDAVRVRTDLWGYGLDAALIINAKRDPLVLAGDDDRAMRDADELGFAARFEKGQDVTTYIFKQEDDPDHLLPDLTTHTLSSRKTMGSTDGLAWMYELAGQYQLWEKGTYSDRTSFAFAGHTRLDFNLASRTRGHVGFLFYDRNFRTPWGRWPLWSELYIYTLIGESTPNRVHVAAWEDISGPFAGAERKFSDKVKGKMRAYYLMSPDQDWDARGFLLQTRLDFQFSKHAKGHLLWEMLSPGDFHLNPPPLTDTVHFLRWEIILSL